MKEVGVFGALYVVYGLYTRRVNADALIASKAHRDCRRKGYFKPIMLSIGLNVA